MGYLEPGGQWTGLYIFILNSIRKAAEEKMMMLRRWAVREHLVSGAYL